MYHILIVDDDLVPTKYYERALKHLKYKVARCRRPGQALAYARKYRHSVSAVVLDIMLPPGDEYRSEETCAGLHTGIFLYKDLQRVCQNALFVVLTNVTNPDTLRVVDSLELECFRKWEWTAEDFAELMRERLQHRGAERVLSRADSAET